MIVDPPNSTVEPAMEDLDEVSISDEFPNHRIQVGSKLAPELRTRLIAFLKNHHHCFAWSHKDMIGVDPRVTTHKLQVDPNHLPFKQNRRKFAPERNAVINEEVQKLLDNGSVREVNYPDWLANVVVVKKKNGKPRVCIDFTTSTRHAPKIHSHCIYKNLIFITE